MCPWALIVRRHFALIDIFAAAELYRWQSKPRASSGTIDLSCLGNARDPVEAVMWLPGAAALDGLEITLCGCLKALKGTPKQRRMAYQRTLAALANLSRATALADGILDPLPDEPDVPDVMSQPASCRARHSRQQWQSANHTAD